MTKRYDALVEAGLSANEAKVYLAALSLGAANAHTIAGTANVHRVNTYDILKRLQQKGLISQSATAKKKLYAVASPQKLSDLLEKKQTCLSEVMPALLADFKSQHKGQEVMLFKGPEGVMTAYKMMLEEKQDLYAIGAQGLNRQYLKHRHFQFDKERKKKGVDVYALYYESARGVQPSTSGWHVRYLPDKYKSAMMVDVCGNLVVTLLPASEIAAIVTKSAVIAEGHRNYFRFMWEFAKP